MSTEVDELKIFEEEHKIMETKLVSRDPVPFSALEWHDNVRADSCMMLDPMVASLKDRKYVDKYPITVSKKGKKYTVLCGNRRTLALKRIKENEPQVFKAILPGGKVPALVLEGLTPREEAIIRIDHASAEDRVALDDESIFLAVKQLVDMGITGRTDIAAKLGLMIPDKVTKQPVPNGSYVQTRSNLARMPEKVQDEFIKLMRDKTSTNVRWAHVAKLFKLWTAGYAVGKLNGSDAFWDLFEKFKLPKEEAEDAIGSVKALTRNEISKAAENLGSINGRLLCLRIAGNAVQDEKGETMSLADIDAKISESEAALVALSDIRNHLTKKKFDAMMAEIMKAK